MATATPLKVSGAALTALSATGDDVGVRSITLNGAPSSPDAGGAYISYIELASSSAAASPAAKARLRYDNTTFRLERSLDATSYVSIPAVMFASTATATVTNTVSELTLVGAGAGDATIPANLLAAGRVLRVTARGVHSTDATAPGTLTIRVKFGSTTIIATAAFSASMAITNREWELQAVITCRTTGASGTVIGQGLAFFSMGASSMNGIEMASASTVTVNTTASQLVDVTAQWGTQDVDNSISCTNVLIEVLH